MIIKSASPHVVDIYKDTNVIATYEFKYSHCQLLDNKGNIILDKVGVSRSDFIALMRIFHDIALVATKTSIKLLDN